MRYCAREKKSFPDDQFDPDPTYGWVHKCDPPHTTRGQSLTSGNLGGIQYAPDFRPTPSSGLGGVNKRKDGELVD